MTDWKHNKESPVAVALSWDGTSTPQLSAKGRDDVAEKILASAREHGIPLYEDGRLADLLSQFELGEEIPRELYLVIAHIIAFTYHIAGRTSVFTPVED